MVLSSLSEGGANVMSEAVAARVPVLATRIDGSIGLLGRDYPAYFPVGDTEALARLLNRIETDAAFLERAARDRAARPSVSARAREGRVEKVDRRDPGKISITPAPEPASG
jgi:glycosyltransferase involved in cell wall biosynthesis